MGEEGLSKVCDLLAQAGIRADADYPAGGWMEISEAVAAVGLEELDCGAGKAVFAVRILSPGSLGGWNCQKTAAAATAALERAELSCSAGRMEYLSGSDCFCILLRAELDVYNDGSAWYPGRCWNYTCNGEALSGVTEFRAEQDLDRRLVGAFCQSEPVGVTPGSGGWQLTMVQMMPVDTLDIQMPEEPFELAAVRNGKTERYSGCCWNRTSAVHTQAGLRLERQGFALKREVS